MRVSFSFVLVVGLIACGGSDGGGAGHTDVTLSPATADLLTCSGTQQFTSSDTDATKGLWSVATTGGGTIDQTGLYTAPNSVTADVSIDYQPAAGGTASATVHLATAHIGSATPVDINFPSDGSVFEEALQARGSRVYGVYTDRSGNPRVMRSNDGGATFTSEPLTTSVTVNCISSAIDAVNPDILYLVYHVTGATETDVVVSASTNGGVSFDAEYIVASSILDGLATELCPTIASPAGDHIVVATAHQNGDQTASWVSTYVSADRGASFGVHHGDEGGDYYSPSDTNAGSAFTTGTVMSDGGQNGPRVFTDGRGHVCISYAVDSDSGCDGSNCIGIYQQCSDDSGANWSVPNKLSTSGAKTFPTGAFSGTGNVAITWVERVSGEDRIFVAISQDNGTGWAGNVQKPFDKSTFGYTGFPVVAWQGNILWVSETVAASDNPQIVIDKTCDFGFSWSGQLAVTPPGHDYGSAMIVTPRGVQVAGFDDREAQSYPLSLYTLTP